MTIKDSNTQIGYVSVIGINILFVLPSVAAFPDLLISLIQFVLTLRVV